MPVQPLAVVEPQFTLLSLGYSGGSVNWEIHLKQDVTDEDCSNSGCYVLGSFTTTVNSNTPYQRVAEEVTIPPVTPGEYYLTAYIDSDDAWSETDETNQTAVWQQKLDVQANSCGCAATGPWAGAPGLLLLVFGLMRRRVHGRGTV
jgi:MYXO-CTERM domain-containing protein